jgi:hypothetical protein
MKNDNRFALSLSLPPLYFSLSLFSSLSLSLWLSISIFFSLPLFQSHFASFPPPFPLFLSLSLSLSLSTYLRDLSQIIYETDSDLHARLDFPSTYKLSKMASLSAFSWDWIFTQCVSCPWEDNNSCDVPCLTFLFSFTFFFSSSSFSFFFSSSSFSFFLSFSFFFSSSFSFFLS